MFCFQSVVLLERLEACRDRNDWILRQSALCRYFVVIPQIHSNGISWASSYGVCGCFWSLDNIEQFANPLFDGVYFPECNVVFVGLEKDFIAKKEKFHMGRNGFLELCLPWNEFIEDGLDFSCKHCFWFRKLVLRVAIMESSKTSVFLGMSRDKLSASQIFLDEGNSILKL